MTFHDGIGCSLRQDERRVPRKITARKRRPFICSLRGLSVEQRALAIVLAVVCVALLFGVLDKTSFDIASLFGRSQAH